MVVTSTVISYCGLFICELCEGNLKSFATQFVALLWQIKPCAGLAPSRFDQSLVYSDTVCYIHNFCGNILNTF